MFCFGMLEIKMQIISLKNEQLALTRAVNVLKKGGVVVLPTDTVYGLCADAMNEKDIKRVFAIKGREASKALPVLVSDATMRQKVAHVPPDIETKIDELGSITAVVHARGWMPLSLRGGKLSIGVRIPNHDFLLEVITKCGGPITGTSANISGQPSQTKIDEVIMAFKNRRHAPDLIVNAGDLPERSPSRIFDFTKTPPQVLRTEAINGEALQKILEP